MKNFFSILLLLSTFTCFGQYIYTDINPDKILSGTDEGPDYEYVDINNDGNNDFTFSDHPYQNASGYHHFNIEGSSQAKFAFSNGISGPNPIYFNYGNTIGSSQGYTYEKSSIGGLNWDINAFLGIQFTQGTDIYYGWIRYDYRYNDEIIIKDYCLNSTPNIPIIAGEQIPPIASDIKLVDNNIYFDGRSLRLEMIPHPFPSNIVEYRCMLIDQNESATFTVDSAILVNPNNYFSVNPDTLSAYQNYIQFTQSTTDVNGDLINSSNYYQAVVLSVVDNTIDTTWYLSSFSNPVRVSNPTSKIHSIYLIDNGNNNNSSDAKLYFQDPANGLGVLEYRLIVSNSTTNSLLNLSQLLDVNSDNYFSISTSSIIDSVILPNNLSDIDGDLMKDSIPYDVYIVSLCDFILTDSSSFGMMEGKFYLNNPDYLYTGYYEKLNFKYHQIDSTIYAIPNTQHVLYLDINNDSIYDFSFISHYQESPSHLFSKLAVKPLQNNKIANMPEIVADTGRQFNPQLPWTTNERVLLERSFSPVHPYINEVWDLKGKYLPFIVYTTTDTLTGWFEVDRSSGPYGYNLVIKGYGYYSSNIAFGIDQPKDKLITDFNVYPNPFTNTLNIESKSLFVGTAEITSIDGKLIHTFEINNQTTSVSLAYLKAGIYLLKIDHPNYTYRKKIIKR